MMHAIAKISPLTVGSPDDLFITCASFEQRCLAASDRLSGYTTRCAIVVNFLSRTNAEGERRKRDTATSLIEMLTTANQYSLPRLVSVAPYDYFGLWTTIHEELQRRAISPAGLRVTIDISCFTKIQLVFLIKTLVEEGIASRIRCLYAVPERYNSKKGDKFSRLSVGYFAPMPLPVRVSPVRRLSRLRRIAVVLLGHEGQRTLSAWRRIDPDFTILVWAASANSELASITQAENKFLVDLVTRDKGSATMINCQYLDVSAVKEQLFKLLDGASRTGAVRVSVIPFGPKPLLLGTLLAAFELDGIDFELMYPIPTSYNSEYSEGLRDVYTFDLDALGLQKHLRRRSSRWAEAAYVFA